MSSAGGWAVLIPKPRLQSIQVAGRSFWKHDLEKHERALTVQEQGVLGADACRPSSEQLAGLAASDHYRNRRCGREGDSFLSVPQLRRPQW